MAGTLEAGQKEGKQYLLPVSVQCPVIFGIEENLSEAGILREEGYQNLTEFLETVLLAAEKTGKGIFEDAAAVDWIEQHCVLEKENTLEVSAAELDELERLLDEVREHSGDNGAFFAPYERISSGDFLLSGCSLADKAKMAQNLALFDQDQEICFLELPSWDGKTTAVITQAVGINSASKYPEEASALVQAFQTTFANSAYSLNDFPAVVNKEFWDTQLSSYFDTMKIDPLAEYEEQMNHISSGGSLNRKWKKTVQGAVTDAVYPKYEMDAWSESKEGTDPEERTVITVYFYDHGMGMESVIYEWLSHAAASFEESTVEIQLISTACTTPLVDAEYMEKAGIGPDILLASAGYFRGYNLIDWYTDLTPYLEQYPNLQG